MVRTVLLRFALLSTALSLAACGSGAVGSTDEPTGQTGSAITGFPNDQTAFLYFLGKGLTNYQAAGIVGNLDQESGVDPTAVEQGGPGRGIAQWSVGGRWDTDANDNCEWYASQQGQSVDSLQLQLEFIWYELTTFSGYGLAALKQSTNVTDATVAFQNDFEGCGTCDQSTRVAYAQNVLSEYGSETVDGGGSQVDAGNPSCTVPNVGTGVCILASTCASMSGYMSTPNYCPGPADIECCTGPQGASDGGAEHDAGSSSSGSSSGGASSSGSSSGGSGSSGSGSSSGGAGSSSGAATGSSSGGTPGDADASTSAGGGALPQAASSGGCSVSSARPEGSLAGLGLMGLVVGLSVRARTPASRCRSRRRPADSRG